MAPLVSCALVQLSIPSNDLIYIRWQTIVIILPTSTFVSCRQSVTARRVAVCRNDEAKTESRDVKSRLAVIRMLITIWLVFIVCWGPFLVFTLVERYSKYWLRDQLDVTTYNRLLPSLHLVTMANSALNPILYAFLSRYVRMCNCQAIARSTN